MTNQSPQKEEVPEEIIKLCKQLAEEVCPNEVYGPFEKEWKKSEARLDYIEGATNGAIAMYHHLQDRPAMKWIQASEQKPDIHVPVIVRVISDHTMMKLCENLNRENGWDEGDLWFWFDTEWLFEPQTK